MNPSVKNDSMSSFHFYISYNFDSAEGNNPNYLLLGEKKKHFWILNSSSPSMIDYSSFPQQHFFTGQAT